MSKRIEFLRTEEVDIVNVGMSLSRKDTVILQLNDHVFSLDMCAIGHLIFGLNKTLDMMKNENEIVTNMLKEAGNEAN